MRFAQLLELSPGLGDFTTQIPEALDGQFQLKTYAAHSLIHQKDSPLKRIGILLRGTFRVVNEFENGNVFMIEVNEAVSFIGEVTLLAGAATTSVTIEAHGFSRISASSGPSAVTWPPSCTAPVITGVNGCSIPPSMCC